MLPRVLAAAQGQRAGDRRGVGVVEEAAVAKRQLADTVVEDRRARAAAASGGEHDAPVGAAVGRAHIFQGGVLGVTQTDRAVARTRSEAAVAPRIGQLGHLHGPVIDDELAGGCVVVIVQEQGARALFRDAVARAAAQDPRDFQIHRRGSAVRNV